MEISINDYKQYKSSIMNHVENIIIEYSDRFETEESAFNLLVARLFANSCSEEHLNITDGPSDQGIDFYTKIDNFFDIYQCKFAKFETINSKDEPLSFDQQGVRDLENSYNYLTSDNVSDTANVKIKELRSKILFESDKEITFNLCIFGKLTDDAKQKFELLKRENEDEKIKFYLYEWTDIAKQLYLMEQSPKEVKFKFRVFENQVLLKGVDFLYLLAYASDFYKLFEKYGWSIFELNVRSELKNSPINKQIINSLTHEKTMKSFHHLNNGILLFCDSFRRKKGEIELNNFQIINGCQTVLSIYRAYQEINNNFQKISTFNGKCLVQVKILIKSDVNKDLIDKVIVSSNNQNPMSLRNLKSNTTEQIKIKALFDSVKWFYQRKDGEFDSLKRLPKIGSFHFKISNYKEDNVYRYIDNSDLAKSWICFTGFSTKAMMTSDFFRDDNLYDIIFTSYPLNKLWEDFLSTNIELKIENKNLYFTSEHGPMVEDFLLSYLIWKFINEYAISPIENRKISLKRQVNEGNLHEDSSHNITDPIEDQAKFLSQDIEYMVNNIINNSKEIFVEMFSFILAKKYGYASSIRKKIIQSSTFYPLIKKPDLKMYINRIEKDDNNVLYSIFEFLKYNLKILYSDIKAEYAAESRRKSYLAKPLFIKRFKNKIIEMDKWFSKNEYPVDWKDYDKSFIDSMPNL